MPVPNSFANVTTSIPLSQLDANFNTPITLGNTAIQLGNTVTTLNNMTLANVTISSGNVTITNVSVTTANVATANVTTSQILNYGTANQVQYLNASKALTGSANLTFDGTTFTHTGASNFATSTGNVGIGTSSPAVKLQVVGSISLGSANNLTWGGAYGAGIPTITADGTNGFQFYPAGSTSGELMRLNASGNLGLGVTPSAWGASFKAIQLANGVSYASTNDPSLQITQNGYYDGTNWRFIANGYATNYQHSSGQHIWRVSSASGTAGNAITFTQAMTLDASGRLGIGTTSPGSRLEVTGVVLSKDLGNGARFDATDTATGGSTFTLNARFAAVGEPALQTQTNHPIIFAPNSVDRGRFTTAGAFVVAKTSAVLSTAGSYLQEDGFIGATRSSNAPLGINRLTNDGDLIFFQQDNTQEGSISVSGNTVSYNPFLGSHAGAFADWSRPEVKIGTIFETINELIDYKVVVIEVPEEVPATEETEATTVNVPKRISYNGNGAVGTTATVEYEGQEYTGIIENERGQLRDFNKHVKVKINDTPDSKAVYGVFVGWNTDPSNDGGVYNDMLIGAVGNYVIRMAAGQAPEIGDLVKADGTGCAIVQEDDIVRTKTVGKITNTIPQLTYEDGSFLVACVLYCG